MKGELDLTRYEGHTPGPWSVYDQGVDDGPEYGAHIQSADPIYDWVVQNITNRADARLIADAPLLLAEVRRLREENAVQKANIKELLRQLNEVAPLRQSHARLRKYLSDEHSSEFWVGDGCANGSDCETCAAVEEAEAL